MVFNQKGNPRCINQNTWKILNKSLLKKSLEDTTIFLHCGERLRNSSFVTHYFLVIIPLLLRSDRCVDQNIICEKALRLKRGCIFFMIRRGLLSSVIVHININRIIYLSLQCIFMLLVVTMIIPNFPTSNARKKVFSIWGIAGMCGVVVNVGMLMRMTLQIKFVFYGVFFCYLF